MLFPVHNERKELRMSRVGLVAREMKGIQRKENTRREKREREREKEKERERERERERET
jgi:hypothetical protein